MTALQTTSNKITGDVSNNKQCKNTSAFLWKWKKKAFPKAHTQLQAVYINQILTAADQDTTLRSLLPRRKQKMLCATLPGSRRLPTSGSSYQGDTLVCETIINKHPSPGLYFTTPSFGEGGDEKERKEKKEQSLFLNSNSTTYFPFLLLISNTSK